MAVSLPYAFRTDFTGKIILKGMVGLQTVLALGLIKTLFLVPSVISTLGILLCLILLTYFGILIFKKLGGASGSITHSEIIVIPTSLFGLTSNSPSGHFALSRFSAIRIEIVPFAAGPGGGSHERVYLQGKDGTPDILIARTQRNQGITLGQELGQLLNLPTRQLKMAY